MSEDTRGIRLEQLGADVERFAVVEDADVRRLGGGVALDRFLLPELRDRMRERPRILPQQAVHAHVEVRGHAHRCDGRHGGDVDVLCYGRRHGKKSDRHGSANGYQTVLDLSHQSRSESREAVRAHGGTLCGRSAT